MSPYDGLPGRAFWRSGVVEKSPLGLEGIYEPKWPINPLWRIGTAGSCFAQHIARFLAANGYRIYNVEQAPAGLPPERHHEFGFSMYSGRYGNIYTARQFRQLAEEALGTGGWEPIIWERGGRYYDALRPAITPNGFASREEALACRAWHLERLRLLFRRSDLFIFTFGLTEAWEEARTGRVVPVAPGIIAGDDEVGRYRFRNLLHSEILADFSETMRLLSEGRPSPPHFLVTVSPVPLTATASGQHVLPATTFSKAVLRSVAGELAAAHANVDYFPSYEIVTNPQARGVFYASNLRSVTAEGVETVMRSFFAAHPPRLKTQTRKAERSAEDVQCEEALLEAFAR